MYYFFDQIIQYWSINHQYLLNKELQNLNKMKTLPLIPACGQIRELQKLTAIIREHFHPEMLILFGHYAGMQTNCLNRGYEMLILTPDKTNADTKAFYNHLDERYPPQEREEKHLSLCILPTDLVREKSPASYFLYSIRKDGLILYQDATCKLKPSKLNPEFIRRKTETYVSLCLYLGNSLLSDAQRRLEIKDYRLATFYLSRALQEFVRGIVFAHFGFLPESRENLWPIFCRLRLYSGEIATLWTSNERFQNLFQNLQRLCYKALFSEHCNITSDLTEPYVRMTIQLQKTAESFYQSRMQFLKNL